MTLLSRKISQLTKKATGQQSRGSTFDNPLNFNNPNVIPFPSAPPAYTERDQAPRPPTYVSRRTTRTNSLLAPPSLAHPRALEDDRFAFLGQFDTVLLIDDSASMRGTRWAEASEALQSIVLTCVRYDEDGIDLYFINAPDRRACHHVRSAEQILDIFDSTHPRGNTLTGKRLDDILGVYMSRYTFSPETTKPLNIIVITDGMASDDPGSIIRQYAQRLDKQHAPPHQVGIQFFQIGDDPAATNDLQYLDDELCRPTTRGDATTAIRDIVDTVPFNGQAGATLTGDGILKVVLGAVHRRLDRQANHGLHIRPSELA